MNIQRLSKILQNGAGAVLLFSRIGPASAASQVLTITPTRSEVSFTVSNLGIHKVHGHFSQFSGQITYDPADITHSQVQATIQIASIDTGNKERDAHLRTADFFDASQFPAMSFQSQSIDVGNDHDVMKGTLTIKGIVKPVVVHFTLQQNSDVNAKTGLQAQGDAMIDRRDFGITYGNAFMIGRQIHIHLAINTL